MSSLISMAGLFRFFAFRFFGCFELLVCDMIDSLFWPIDFNGYDLGSGFFFALAFVPPPCTPALECGFASLFCILAPR